MKWTRSWWLKHGQIFHFTIQITIILHCCQTELHYSINMLDKLLCLTPATTSLWRYNVYMLTDSWANMQPKAHLLSHSNSLSGGCFQNESFESLQASSSISDSACSRILASVCVPAPLLPITNTITCRLNYEPAFCLLILIIDFEINHSTLFGE